MSIEKASSEQFDFINEIKRKVREAQYAALKAERFYKKQIHIFAPLFF